VRPRDPNPVEYTSAGAGAAVDRASTVSLFFVRALQ